MTTPAAPTECQSVMERRTLTMALADSVGMGADARALVSDGSEKSLMVTFSIVHGVVREYLEDGDQTVENCTCGEHGYRAQVRTTLRAMSDQALAHQASIVVGGIDREEVERELDKRRRERGAHSED